MALPRTILCTVRPEFVAAGLKTLANARAKCKGNEVIGGRIDKLLLPLWYMQLQWPDKYALDPAKAPALVAEFRRVVDRYGITYVREHFGSPSMPVWLAEMGKRWR